MRYYNSKYLKDELGERETVFKNDRAFPSTDGRESYLLLKLYPEDKQPRGR